MPSPWKHPDSGTYYIRVAIPTDLTAKLGTSLFKVSLRTKDQAIAKVLFIERLAAVQKEWAMHRAGPKALTHKQRNALAGVRYKDTVAALENDPESVTIWERMFLRYDLASETPKGLETVFGGIVDSILKREGLLIDAPSRSLLLQDVCRADREAAQQLLRNAEGDYSPDPNALRFADWQSVKPVVGETLAEPVAAHAVTLTHLFDLWKRDHLANGKPIKTVGDFLQKVGSLKSFIGHDDAMAVTDKNISDWLEHLRHESNLSAKTVSEKYLAAIRAVYRLAMAKIVVTTDPTKHLKVAIPKAQKTRPKGFTDEEAVKILSCALNDPETLGGMSEHNKLACRWVPWICAYTGARGGEIAQLRREDLVEEHGIPCIRITPDAGSVKTNAYRLVPIHPHLIELGLVPMIRSRAEGPLFYPANAKAQKDGTTPGAVVRGKVGGWVRNVAGVKDPKVQPNHAWRHRFKTLAREHDISDKYSDAITGHEDGKASTSYGEMPMKALYREIVKLPRYPVTGVGFKAPAA